MFQNEQVKFGKKKVKVLRLQRVIGMEWKQIKKNYRKKGLFNKVFVNKYVLFSVSGFL